MYNTASCFIINTLNAYAEQVKRIDCALANKLISYTEYITALNDINAEVNREIVRMLSEEMRDYMK